MGSKDHRAKGMDHSLWFFTLTADCLQKKSARKNYFIEKKSVVFLFKLYILPCEEVIDDDREDGDNSQLRSRLKKIS